MPAAFGLDVFSIWILSVDWPTRRVALFPTQESRTGTTNYGPRSDRLRESTSLDSEDTRRHQDENGDYQASCQTLPVTALSAKSLTAGRKQGAAKGWSKITFPSRCPCWKRCGSHQRTTFWTSAAERVGCRGGWQNWCPRAAWWGWTSRTKLSAARG